METIRRRFGRDVQMDRSEFSRVLNDVGPVYSGLADKLFTAFDTNRDGRLDAHELAGGLSVLAGNVKKNEKLSLMFEMYNTSGSDSISRQEMQRFMDSMFTVALQYADDQIHSFDNLLSNSTSHARRAGVGSGSDLMDDIQRQLRNKLKMHQNRVVDDAFARAPGDRLSKVEFKRWADSQPNMFRWLTELGKKWTHQLQKNTTRSSSAAQRKFQGVRLDDVHTMVKQLVRGNRMTEADIENVLERLRLKNRALKRRIMSAFRDRNGEVSTHEFCSCLAMLCSSGNPRQKLEFAFRMFDSDGSGTLTRIEVESFVQDFFKMARVGLKKMIKGVSEMFPGDDERFIRTMEQLTDTRIRQFATKVVDDAMRFSSNGALDQRQFKDWCGQGDGMSRYLEDIGAQFMDSIDEEYYADLDGGQQFDDNEQWEPASQRVGLDDSYNDIELFLKGGQSASSGYNDSSRDPYGGDSRRDASASRDSYRDRGLEGVTRSAKEDQFLNRLGVQGETVDGMTGTHRAWRFGREAYPRRYQHVVQRRRTSGRPRSNLYKNHHLRFLQKMDVRKIAQVFMNESRAGEMQYQQFARALGQLGVQNEAIAKGMFSAFDANGNGSLDLNEFTSGIAVLSVGDFREKVRLAFEVFDRRQTGRISRADLKKYLHSFYLVVRGTIARVTSSVADVFGVASSDSAVLAGSNDRRASFGKRFASTLDRHLSRIIEQMVDGAFRRAKDGYEGGGNLSLADFQHWAEEQPNLVAWYENLGQQWLSSINARSKNSGSSVMAYRSARQANLRRMFQEMDLHSLIRDLQRRSGGGGGGGGKWHDIDQRDFTHIVKEHVRAPSIAVVDKLFSAFDVENKGRIDAREAIAGLCVLGIGSQGHSNRNYMRALFQMFDQDRSGSIERDEMTQCFRSFFMLAYDVVHNSLLNCSELFGSDDTFVSACWDVVDEHTNDTLKRIVETIFRKADTGRDGKIQWNEFERWENRDHSLADWMGTVADMWCETIAEDDALFPSNEDELTHGNRYPEELEPHMQADYDDYKDHYSSVQRGYGKKKKNKYRPPYFLSGPLAPVPGGLGAMGYPYQSYLKKIFSLTLISHRTNHKKFTYRNPYAKRTCFSFHSSNPNIIEIKAPQLVIPPSQERFARLTFHPASPGNSECLLYIHNDDADRNEECIRFDLSYMKDATNVRPHHNPNTQYPTPNATARACFAASFDYVCAQPYDKFAGLYGAKTYWGYDGADTGEDPFEARMWDSRGGGGGGRVRSQQPGLWDGYEGARCPLHFLVQIGCGT